MLEWKIPQEFNLIRCFLLMPAKMLFAQINWGISIGKTLYEGQWTRYMPPAFLDNYRGFEHQFGLKAGVLLEKKIAKRLNLAVAPAFLWRSNNLYNRFINTPYGSVSNYYAELPVMLLNSRSLGADNRWIWGGGLAVDVNLNSKEQTIKDEQTSGPAGQPLSRTQFVQHHKNQIIPAVVLETGFEIGVSRRNMVYIGLTGHLQIPKSSYMRGAFTDFSNNITLFSSGRDFGSSYLALNLVYKFRKPVSQGF